MKKGFFRAEGVEEIVNWSREASWATVRDKVAVGALDGAHMLAPLAVAMSLGVGCDPGRPWLRPFRPQPGAAPVTLSTRLAENIIGAGAAGPKTWRSLISRRREQGSSPLTFAAVFPYSVHNYLLRDWLAQVQASIPTSAMSDLTVGRRPARSADLLEEGVIEGFCAGEPWNQAAERAGAGRVVMRASDFAPGAPDKVFATTEAWALARTRQAAGPAPSAPAGRGLGPTTRRTAPNWSRSWRGQTQSAWTPRAIPSPPGLADTRFHGEGTNRPEPVATRFWLVEQMRRWGQAVNSSPGRFARAAALVYRPDLFDEATRPPSTPEHSRHPSAQAPPDDFCTAAWTSFGPNRFVAAHAA